MLHVRHARQLKFLIARTLYILQLFLEALMLYNAGKPMMADKEWDALKLRLKDEGSAIAVAVRRHLPTSICASLHAVFSACLG